MTRSFLDWTFKGRSAKWLYVVGVVVLIAYVHYAGIPISMLFGLAGDTSEWPSLLAFIYSRLPLFLFIVAVPLWVHFVHKRPWWSVVSARPQVEWWNLGVGVLLALVMLVVSSIMNTMFFGVAVTFAMPDPWIYWPSLLFAAFFIFLQTTTEELVFRGYAVQAVRRFTASPVAIIVITALLFALPHYQNVVAIGWPWWGMLTFALSAALYAFMILRTGSLWMPIGWHFMNNFFLSRIYVVEADLAAGQPAFFHAVGGEQSSLATDLLIKAVTYFLVALLVHYLVSRREAAQAGGEAEAAAQIPFENANR